ncbi:MAG: DUF5684 domain-containing protein [Microthrixaceae bacterium]
MLNLLGAIAQTTTDDAGGGGVAVIVAIVYIALFVVYCVAYWKVFTKLGLPGWMGIVPFVNVYMIFKARGERSPVLWLILCLVPCINIIAVWFLASDTADMFDKELGWKIFLFLIPGIGHLVLGFGDSTANPAKMAPGVGLNQGGYAA